jgi:hypothetical protein
MTIPAEIIDKIKEAKCILFLGSMASAPASEGCPYKYVKAPPGGAELSRRLAKACAYPFEDDTNLQRVSLFFEFRKDGSRQSLVDTITREIGGWEDGADAGGTPSRIPFEPSPALHMLAALPFPIIITTNYDKLFDIALNRANTRKGRFKTPLLRVYDPHEPPDFVPLDPEEDKPVFCKLHGDIDTPDSLVVTEEDYITFIQLMTDRDKHPMHENLRARVNSWPVLFIGYSLKDYNLRLLFKTLRWNLSPADYPMSLSVDPYPDDIIVTILQRGEKPVVNFVRENLWGVVPQLYRDVIGKEYPG